ncbi:MAG: hypothetical protein WDM78_08145 [Puia sp.]
MIGNENDPLKKYLSNQFRSGKRWIAFNHRLPIADWKYEKCFTDYQLGAAYCRGKAAQGSIYRISTLNRLLKILNNVTVQVPATLEKQKLQSIINQYPIHSEWLNTSFEENLWNGDFLPVMWSKLIYPLSNFKKYFIIEQININKLSGRENLKVLDCTEDFPTAITTLHNHIQRITTKGNSPQLFLVGAFSNDECHLDTLGSQENNTGLLLYEVHPVIINSNKKISREIYQINDPSKPLLNTHPMFIRYFHQKHILQFYNGALQKTNPGTGVENFDLQYFYPDKNSLIPGTQINDLL